MHQIQTITETTEEKLARRDRLIEKLKLVDGFATVGLGANNTLLVYIDLPEGTAIDSVPEEFEGWKVATRAYQEAFKSSL